MKVDPNCLLVGAIDAGKPTNVGWAVSGHSAGEGNLETFIDSIVAELASGRKIAIGIEAPLWTPAGRSFETMLKAREPLERVTQRAWSSSAGACALAAGLGNLTWLLETLRGRAGRICITTQDASFGPDHQILLWEAFVSGKRKAAPFSDTTDAIAAVAAFEAQKNAPFIRRLTDMSAVNLACAVALATDHDIDPLEICLPTLLVTDDLPA